uniref:DRBM domain-containing protein n=1 Tax=Panagrolaimus superbus TaxID=310955 RepID=A0A914Y3F7_9BILA
MEKTLGAILEEGAVKIGAKHSTIPLPDTSNSNLFCVKRTFESKDFGNFEAFASSPKKRSAQHLAAGFILLQILDKPCWNLFPFRLPNVEEVRIALENEIDSLKNDGMTVAENPVGGLQQMCKQRGLIEPAYKCFDAEDKMYTVTCVIQNFKEVSATATSKKQAKANAARDMIMLMSHDVVSSTPVAKDSEDGFKPALSDEKMKASVKASKEEILQYIEKSVASVEEDSCSVSAENLEIRGILTQVFKKNDVKIEKRDHKSLDPSKMLRTLHIVDKEAYDNIKQLCRKTVLYSFIGIGENDKTAKNEAARNLLFYVKNYYDLRVLD